ncbi:MAG: matrixin family metalloprotease [Myxococcales bacterium]|jgi:MYXO-CTERM domain-containing protein
MTRALLFLALTFACVGSARAWEPIDPARPVWRRPLAFALNERGSQDLPFEQTEAAVVRGFDDWSAPECSGLQVEYLGLTDLDAREYTQVVSWTETDWELGPETIGATLNSYTVGEPATIEWSTMQLNGQDYRWVLGRPRRLTDVDVYTIVLHEAGHYLGLGHSDELEAVMAPAYAGPRPGLALDDVEGVCALYPPEVQQTEGDGTCETVGCEEPGPPPASDPLEPEPGPGPVPEPDPEPDAGPPVECFDNRRCDDRALCLDGRCVPAAQVVGASCTFDDDCASGLCQSQGGEALCTARCDADLDCPTGFYCGGATGFRTCRRDSREPEAGAESEPAAPAVDPSAAAPADDGGGCSTTGEAGSDAPWLAFAIVALVLRSRRRGDSAARVSAASRSSEAASAADISHGA